MGEKVPIKLKIGQTGIDSRIEIAGIDMSHSVARVELVMDVNDVTRVRIDFLGVEVEADGEFFDTSGLGDQFKNYVAGYLAGKEGASA